MEEIKIGDDPAPLLGRLLQLLGLLGGPPRVHMRCDL